MNNLFTATKEERIIIKAIADRVVAKCKEDGDTIDPLYIQMDIEATHCNGCPLRLQDLLDADDFNLFHDVFGIAAHLNRRTGRIERFFHPRFSRGTRARKGKRGDE